MAQAATPQVLQKYQELQQEVQRLVIKISELEMDRNEHQLVEDTLEPLNADRRAFRLVGEVLVERTVQEVLPSVRNNRTNLEAAIAALKENLEVKQKELGEMKKQYNIPTNS